jgi:hypothetical protein
MPSIRLRMAPRICRMKKNKEFSAAKPACGQNMFPQRTLILESGRALQR